MKTLTTFLAVLFFSASAYKAIIKDAETRRPLHGVAIKILSTGIGGSSGKVGLVVVTGIPSGKQVIHLIVIRYLEQFSAKNIPRPAH